MSETAANNYHHQYGEIKGKTSEPELFKYHRFKSGSKAFMWSYIFTVNVRKSTSLHLNYHAGIITLEKKTACQTVQVRKPQKVSLIKFLRNGIKQVHEKTPKM